MLSIFPCAASGFSDERDVANGQFERFQQFVHRKGVHKSMFRSAYRWPGLVNLHRPDLRMVGIFSMLAVQFNTDYRLALSFLVLLNINLAMINLLPLPVLDGGHIAMSILEWIRRRPLNVKFVEYATTVFAVLLISFMLYVTFFDIKRIPLLNSLFKRKVQIEQQDKPADSSPNPEAPTPAPAPSHP